MNTLLVCSDKTAGENRDIIQRAPNPVTVFPTIRFEPASSGDITLEQYDWIVVTSRMVFEFLIKLVNVNDLKKKKIGAVGSSTGDYIRSKGYDVDFIPSKFTGADFAREFIKKFPDKDIKLFNPGSNLSKDDLSDIFSREGYQIESKVIYKTLHMNYPEDKIEEIRKTKWNRILFTSPSSWKNFREIMGEDYDEKLKSAKLGAIGPTTAKQLEKDGFFNYSVPNEYSLKGLIEII